jgi:hypothetical protein
MLLGLLLIYGAPLASLLLVAHGSEELVGLAGSYSVVLLQQKEIQQKTEELAGEYHFDPSLLQREVNVAALAHFSQETMRYWYGLAHGVSGSSAPVWDEAPFVKALQEDADFMARWNAEGTEPMASEAAQKLVTAIHSAVFPLQRVPMTLELERVASQGFLKRALYVPGLLLITVALLLLAIRLLQRNRPYQSLWFYAMGLLTGSMGAWVLLLKLRELPLDTLLAKYSPVLAYYGSAILARYETLLSFFGVAYTFGGGTLLILFLGMRHQWKRNTHHELTSFF